MQKDEDFIQQQNKRREDYKIIKEISSVRQVLSKRSTKGTILLVIFSIVVPLLTYYFIFDRDTFQPQDSRTCLVDKTYRVPCGKPNANFTYCDSIHCCFDNTTKLCFHYLPSKYYYFLQGSEYQRSLKETPYKKEMSPNISLTVSDIDENSVTIMLHDSELHVPTEVLPDKNYFWEINETHLYVQIFRNGTDNTDLLLTTARGPTIISQRYWEWSFQLTDQYLFGLGQTLIELDENSTLTKVIYGNSKDHNTLPVFMAYVNGSYHGLIVRHSGPLEVTVLPSKLVSLKSLAGRSISLEVNVGPTVRDVINQQRRQRAISVEMETLGVHVCREGSSFNLQNILNEYQQELNDDDLQFKYESDCVHENLATALMNEEEPDITKVQDVIQTIVNGGRQFMLALFPQVLDSSFLYENTTNLNVFYKTIKQNKSEDYKGKFLGANVAYPYFQETSIDQYLEVYTKELIKFFKEPMPTKFILGYNWPDDDNSLEIKESDEDFQYLSKALTEAMSTTLPWNVTINDEKHFLHHNDYAALQVEKLRNALGAASTFFTASHNFDTVGPVILQNIDISWTNFKNAIVTLLSNSIFGYPLTGIPVCGSTSNFNSSQESLCMRWYLMASTAPIFRISSRTPRRDPKSLATLTTGVAGNTARDAIDFRYSLRYYFYTVLNNNEPLMRPMFYDFSDDNETFPLVEQYMVGGCLLVGQPTLPDQTQIKIYLPKSVDTWYEFWGGAAYSYSTRNTSWVTLSIVETDWIAFIPEGVIVPFTDSSTNEGNTEIIKLIVALNDTENKASGSLKFGVESQFSFTSTDQELTITRNAKETTTFMLNQITVYRRKNVTTYENINQTLSDNTSFTYK